MTGSPKAEPARTPTASGATPPPAAGIPAIEGPLPRGVGVALVTMFAEDGRPDVESTVARALACVARGISSVLVAGTTGEAFRLDADDRIRLGGAVKEALGDVTVVVGTGSPDSAVGLSLTEAVARAGVADALLVLSPGDVGAEPFYRSVRQVAGTTPVLAYHYPSVSPPGVDAGDVPGLDVDGIKDSSGSADRLAELVELGVAVYVGNPILVSLAGGCGGAGALLAAANVAPAMCIAAWEGDMVAQRQLFAVHLRARADFPGYLKRTPPER